MSIKLIALFSSSVFFLIFCLLVLLIIEKCSEASEYNC